MLTVSLQKLCKYIQDHSGDEDFCLDVFIKEDIIRGEDMFLIRFKHDFKPRSKRK